MVHTTVSPRTIDSMRLTYKVLSNGVSRRIVLLFIFATILPLVIFAGLTLYQVRENLVEQHSQQLRKMAKTIGMDIFEGLQYSKDQLQLISSVLKVENSLDIENYLQHSDPIQVDRFDSLFILSPQSSAHVLYGTLHHGSEDLHKIINNQFVPSKAMLLVKSGKLQNHNPSIYIFVPMNKNWPSGSLLGAELNTNTLLNTDLLSTQNEAICIITQSGVPLYCNQEKNIPWLAKIIELAQHSNIDNSLFFNDEQQEMSSAYWSIFLKPHYQVDHWNVAIALPHIKQVEAAQAFQDVILRVGVITFILVVLLSISSIRKVLHPLEELLTGTRQLSKGLFMTRVSIETRDEFQELGISFNNMAERLGNYFSQQKVLIDFSSRIQNANTTKTALKVAFETIPQFTHHRNCLLVHIDAHSNFYEMDYIYSDDKKIFERSMLHMASFESLPSAQWKGTLNNASKFLPILPEVGIPSACEITLMPALHNGRVTAYLVMYNLNSTELGESTQSLLTQFRDILASALSSITLKKQLQYQADHDPLTGLPNRKLIKIETEKAIQVAHVQHHEIAIMILDIDRFKMINDSMGHIIGDELLRQLANRLSQFTSRRDLLSRFAGDEFVFLFTSERESIRNTIPDIIDRLDRVFIDPYNLGSRNVRISASMGIAIYPDDGDTFIDLLKNADAAMYKAKRDNPGSHAFFSKNLQDSLSDEMEIEQDLIDALTENQFELYYQPSIHLPSGNMIGAEALLRWHRPGHALVSPGIFIELAEDTGLIEPIGNWVMKHACESFLRWQQQGIALEYISINVSSIQLKSSKFVETVKHILHITGMKPTHLELEITETAFIKDYQASLEKLKDLRAFGVKIAIDDFGTGYASLKYLKQLPADRLKIDRLFIKDLPENPNDAAIISSLVTLTKELNLELIAEGIEKDIQRDHLIKAGVMMAQGYLMSPPLSNEEFRNYYLSNRQAPFLGSLSECSE